MRAIAEYTGIAGNLATTPEFMEHTKLSQGARS